MTVTVRAAVLLYPPMVLSVDVNVTPDKRKVLLENEQAILTTLQEVRCIAVPVSCSSHWLMHSLFMMRAQGLDAMWQPSRYTITRALQGGGRKRAASALQAEQEDCQEEQEDDEEEEDEEGEDDEQQQPQQPPQPLRTQVAPKAPENPAGVLTEHLNASTTPPQRVHRPSPCGHPWQKSPGQRPSPSLSPGRRVRPARALASL